MADLISDLAEATSVAESLSIVKEILQSTITRCTDKSKLSTVGKMLVLEFYVMHITFFKVKMKIKTVKRKNGEI